MGMASAACIALAIFLKAPVVQPTLESSHIKMLECYVGNGEKQVITMSDSTTVILNSGSVLIYPENFGADEREVYLTGEAIFDVTKDASHPFIVKTSDFSIKVLGTLFNVCSYPEADSYTLACRQPKLRTPSRKPSCSQRSSSDANPAPRPATSSRRWR